MKNWLLNKILNLSVYGAEMNQYSMSWYTRFKINFVLWYYICFLQFIYRILAWDWR